MEGPDVVPHSVVAQDPDHGEVEADQGVVFEPVEAEGAVAEHDPDELVGIGHLGGDGVWHAGAKRPEWARVEHVTRSGDLEPAGGGGDDVATIHGDDRFGAEERADLAAKTLRLDG